MSSHLTILGRLRAKPGQEAALRAALLALAEPSRAEAGCLNYDLHEAADEPGLFVLYENWADRAALDRHLAEPHSQASARRMPELLAGPLGMEALAEISTPAPRRLPRSTGAVP